MEAVNAIDLSFVTDVEVRRLLETYHEQALACFNAGGYLGMIVGGGGVLEGLLAWALITHGGKDAVGRLNKPVEELPLAQLIDLTVGEELVGPDARSAASAVMEFRNFVHPYALLRARSSALPDKAHGLAVLFGVQEIVRSLRLRLAERTGSSAARAEEPAPAPLRAGRLPWQRKAPTVQAGDESAADLFFSWVIPGRLAGARAPMSGHDLKVLSDLGISLLVRLTEARFVTTEQVQEEGLEDFHDPVPDFGVPQLDQMLRIVDRVQTTLGARGAAVISCLAGHGRTGTMLSCCLVAQGLSAEAALGFMELVGRPHSETEQQRDAVRRFAVAWAERAGHSLRRAQATQT